MRATATTITSIRLVADLTQPSPALRDGCVATRPNLASRLARGAQPEVHSVLAVPGRPPPPAKATAAALFDFRPVLRNRSAFAYSLAYCVHTLEMNALRGWGVAVLTWVAASTGLSAGLLSTVAAYALFLPMFLAVFRPPVGGTPSCC